jgi:hypothetical protein
MNYNRVEHKKKPSQNVASTMPPSSLLRPRARLHLRLPDGTPYAHGMRVEACGIATGRLV